MHTKACILNKILFILKVILDLNFVLLRQTNMAIRLILGFSVNDISHCPNGTFPIPPGLLPVASHYCGAISCEMSVLDQGCSTEGGRVWPSSSPIFPTVIAFLVPRMDWDLTYWECYWWIGNHCWLMSKLNQVIIVISAGQVVIEPSNYFRDSWTMHIAIVPAAQGQAEWTSFSTTETTELVLVYTSMVLQWRGGRDEPYCAFHFLCHN